MEGTQLEIMKVIQFPKNKHVENKIRNEKLQVALKMLDYLVAEGADFHIIVDKKSALELFEETGESKLRKYLIITSNQEEGKNLKIDGTNSNVYVLNGDEFD